MPDQKPTPYEVRVTALSLATQIAAHQQVGKYDGNVVVHIAAVFEKYLIGERGR